MCGQDDGNHVINYNQPPDGQPTLWCDWVITEDRKFLEWNGSEKFYYYVEWLEYLIQHFFKVWGYVINGEVKFRGEDFDDCGRIVVVDNKIGVEWGSL
jgi:hypothetical protein